MTAPHPTTPLSEILLDRLVFAAGNLAARTRGGAARAEVMACVQLYHAMRRAALARDQVEAMEARLRTGLERMAAEADQIAAAQPGFRKDING